ncbi:MAG: TauD/TfdA family dioxygenase [Alphaproteobacteria bacterium]|nr:TauD/TfdA family dioxygenase [Alphaproteobacteria bacterium]
MEQQQSMGGRAAWTGDDLRADEAGWRLPLSEAAKDEIDKALAFAETRGCAWHEVDAGCFPLSGFAADLAAAADELEYGRGVIQFKGLPVERYSKDQLKTIFYGIASHLGQPVYQSASGELLGEIRDEGAEVGKLRGQLTNADGTAFLSSRARVQSPQPLRWHTDRTDVVGLLAVGMAAEGGASRLCSAVAIHDAMIARRPDLAELLYHTIHRSRLGEEVDGAGETYPLPVFTVTDGRFASHYSRTYVEAGQTLAQTPQMTSQQWEALDLLASLGDELGYEMDLEPGDMQFLNNHVVYHARGDFKDDPATGQVRNLFRIWLSMPNSRRLAEEFSVLFGETGAGTLRGGIRQPGSGVNAPRV